MFQFGFHTSITPTILDGIKYVESLGGNAVQIFMGSNRSSSLKSKQIISDEEKERIRTYIKDHNIICFIHAIYLSLNFCAFPPENKRIHYAHQNIIYDLEMGQKIGAKGVVLHIGVQKTMPKDDAYKNMIKNIIYIILETNKTAPDVILLLETPAGQGTQIATTLTELSILWTGYHNMLEQYYSIDKTITYKELQLCKSRLGICVDTAHIFSGGIDLRYTKTLKDYFKQFNKMIGIKNIALIHLNDSNAPLNSRRDIHQGIGDGYIFGNQEKDNPQQKNTGYLLSLKELVLFAKGNKIPIILETHKAGSPDNPEGELYAQELALIRDIASGITTKELQKWKLQHITKKTKKLKRPLTITRTINPIMMASPANISIINRLKMLQDYYNYIDNDRIRGIAYGRAILALKNYPEEILSGSQVKGVKGIGDKISLKIDQYLQDAEMKIFKELNIIKKLDEYNMNKYKMINSILGFGSSRVKELKKSGINTVNELKDAFKDGKIDLNNQEVIGLKYHNDLSKKIPKAITSKIGKNIDKIIKTSGLMREYDLSVEIAGSYPSGKEESKDIDILIITRNYLSVDSMPKKILVDIQSILKKAGILIETLSIGKSKILAIIKYNGIARHLDIRLIPKTSEVFGRFYFTSGREFNQMIRGKAKQLGYKLNEYGLYDIKTGKPIEGLENEKQIMAHLDLNFIPMQKRR